MRVQATALIVSIWSASAAIVLLSQRVLANAPAIDRVRDHSGTQSAAVAEPAIVSAANSWEPTNEVGRAADGRDDWEVAKQLLPRAKAGDRDAQYRLFAVIDDCEALMDYYFTHQGNALTLDEALQKAANESQRRQARDGFVHCHRFREENVAFEVGTADYWLARATEGGQPLAQAVTARRRLDRDFRDTAVPLFSSSSFSISIPSGAHPDRRAVDLLRSAVKSLDPQVLEIIGEEQTELHGSRMAETVDRFAWIYIACQRGLDCSPTSRWARDCPDNCNRSTAEGIIMAWSRDDWPAVQQRAQEINAKLNSARWDELGLGP